jgi:hypothetical protein
VASSTLGTKNNSKISNETLKPLKRRARHSAIKHPSLVGLDETEMVQIEEGAGEEEGGEISEGEEEASMGEGGGGMRVIRAQRRA